METELQKMIRQYTEEMKGVIKESFGLEAKAVFPKVFQKGLETGEFVATDGKRYAYELNGNTGKKSLTQIAE